MGLHYVPARPGGRQPTPDILGAVLKAEAPEDEALRKHTEETAEIMQAMVWDYTQAGNNAAKVIEHTVEIKRNERRFNEAAIEAGKHLLAVKELLPHGAWGDWLETEFHMSDSTAQSLMNIARRFGANSQPVGNLSYSVLAMLTSKSVPEAAVNEVIQRSQAGETVTKATAKAVIETHKPKAAHTVNGWFARKPTTTDAEMTALIARYVRQNFTSRNEALKFLINRDNELLNRLERAAYEQRVEFDRPALFRAVDAAITLTMQAAEWRATPVNTAGADAVARSQETAAPYKLPERFDGLYSKCVLNGSTYVVVYAGDLPGITSTSRFDDYHEMIAFMDRRLAAQQGSRPPASTQPAAVQAPAATVVVGEVQPGRGRLVAKHAIWKWLTERCGSNFRLMVELGEALHYQEMRHPLWSEMYPTGSNPDDVFWALEQCIDQAAALVPDFAQGPVAYVATDTLRRAVLNWVRSRYEEYYGQVACLQCMIDDPMGDEDLQRMEPMLPTPYRKDDLIVAMGQALDYLRSMEEPEEESGREGEGETVAEAADTLTPEDFTVMHGLPPLQLPSAKLMQLKGLRAEFQMFVEDSLETFGDLTGQHTATLEVGRKVMQLTAILDREIALLEGKEVAEE